MLSNPLPSRRPHSLITASLTRFGWALCLMITFAGTSHAQQRLADASTSDPVLADVRLNQNIELQANDIIFGQRASGFEDANSDTPANDAQAARFLTQATFGPTVSEMGELKSIGYTAWIDRQIGLTATLQRPDFEAFIANEVVTNPRAAQASRNVRMERWFATAATASDQLRQRMAFALSQILVISDVDGLANQPIGVAEYNDILLRNALGSYRTLLQDVTYSPMMGQFLTTLRNQKTDWTLVNNVLTPGLVAPDENYSREIMQLFSIGLIERNRDFSPILANGQPVPTYNQDIITQTAKVFTGLGYRCSPQASFGTVTLNHNCGCTGIACNFSTTAFFSNPQRYVVPQTMGQPILTALYHPDSYAPMMCFPRYADTGRSQTSANGYAILPAPNDQKTIIGGIVINPSPVACYTGTPAGDQTACVNYCNNQVDTVLNALASHPNVAPFLSRQLIQRLTTSNPSSAYIDRVAAVFENDGTGTRGNLAAVAKAILLDSEARSASPSINFGKLREPLLRLTAIWRAFDAKASSNGTYGVTVPERAFVQRPLGAPSVFNFYEPDYQQAGEIANAGLFSPEFQIVDESTSVSAADELYIRIFAGYSTAALNTTTFSTPALSAYLAPEVIDGLPDSNDQLLEALNVRLMYGQMSSTMKTKLLALMNGAMASTDKRRRALSMIHLIAITPEFAVQR